jgi:hypothetical protein
MCASHDDSETTTEYETKEAGSTMSVPEERGGYDKFVGTGVIRELAVLPILVAKVSCDCNPCRIRGVVTFIEFEER